MTYKKTNNKFLLWFKKPLNWLYVVIGILIFFPVFRYVRKQLELNKAQKNDLNNDVRFNENKNPVVVQNKATAITSRKDIIAAAQSIAHNLGTKYSDNNSMWSWLNPYGWTENDKIVADTVIKQRLNYKLLVRLYFECYSNSRSLSDDLLKYLDDAELKRVQKYINL